MATKATSETTTRKVSDVKFKGTKKFFAAIKKADRAEYPLWSLSAEGSTLQVFVNQLESVEEGGDQFLQVGAKLLGEYVNLTAKQYRGILAYVAERRVHWFRNQEGQERKARLYKVKERNPEMKPAPRHGQTDPLSKFIVLLPIDDATPGERNPEIEPSVLDIFPELEKPIKE